MKIQQFKVTLQEEVIISERAATEGGHSSLDYLPGATFLGAVATHLYDKLKQDNPEDAYTIFHSGKVRFGNALPLSEDDQLSYPMPLCWYTNKHEEDSLCNYQHSEYEEYNDEIQAKQKRDGYVSLRVIKKNPFTNITPRFRMKTAINPEVGTAQNHQIFGYSSLPTGQAYIFTLEADQEIESARWDEIIECLLKNNLKLGGSRSAEYGAVKIEKFDRDEERGLPETSKEVTIWLLADAALQDKWGQPLLYPTAESVGLPAHFELDPKKTFVRSRRYAPFNATRRRRELERVVLSMGSVLHFSSQENRKVDDKVLQKIQTQGIGLYRQTGLGRVWVNPKLLADKNPKFRKIGTQEASSNRNKASEFKSGQEAEPNHLVFRYLDKRLAHASDTHTIENEAQKWIKQLESLYDYANALSYTAAGTCPGPTPTQWGQVMEAAKNATDDTLLELFFGEHAVCKEDDLQWSKKRIFYERKKEKEIEKEIDDFRKWLMYQICREKQRHLRQAIVTRFARLAMDEARKQTQGK